MEAWYKAITIGSIAVTAMSIAGLGIFAWKRGIDHRRQRQLIKKLEKESRDQLDLSIELHESDRKLIDLLKSRHP